MLNAAVYEPLVAGKGRMGMVAAFVLGYFDAVFVGAVVASIAATVALVLSAILDLHTSFSGARTFILGAAYMGFIAGAMRRVLALSHTVDQVRQPFRKHPKGPACMLGMLFPFLLCAWMAVALGAPVFILAGVAAETALALHTRQG